MVSLLLVLLPSEYLDGDSIAGESDRILPPFSKLVLMPSPSMAARESRSGEEKIWIRLAFEDKTKDFASAPKCCCVEIQENREKKSGFNSGKREKKILFF